MNTHGYGRQPGLSAKASLWMALALLVISLVLSSVGYESAAARASTQGTWCERTGRSYNVNGDEVKAGRWSEDGGGSWYE